MSISAFQSLVPSPLKTDIFNGRFNTSSWLCSRKRRERWTGREVPFLLGDWLVD